MYLALGWLGDSTKTIQIDPKHPLFLDCKQYTEEEIEEITDDQELILALRSCLRYNVSRVAGKWESTIPFIDDMINEGMLAIVEWVPRRHETESEHSVMRRATSAIINAIEIYINANQALAAPSRTTQRRRIEKGDDPIYLAAITNEYTHCEMEDTDPDTYKRDVMEALEAIEARDELDAFILCQDSWGWTANEIAQEFGVTRQTVQQRRANLYQQFLDLTR